MSRFQLPDSLARDVLAEIGADAPTDAAGVAELYRRFCAVVPFDPVMKAVTVREGTRPPGADPVEVAERFLATGIGGTCWATCGVLAGLFEHAGLDATIGLERMLDIPAVDFHCFTVLEAGHGPVALDPVHVSGDPLPMRQGAVGTHPVYGTSFASDEMGRLLHNWQGPEHGGRYVVLSDRLGVDDVAAFCDVSVQHTGVRARRLFQRTVTPDGIRIVRPTEDGHGVVVREWTAGVTIEDGDPERCPPPARCRTVEVHEPAEVLDALRINEAGMELVVRSGLATPVRDAWRFVT